MIVIRAFLGKDTSVTTQVLAKIVAIIKRQAQELYRSNNNKLQPFNLMACLNIDFRRLHLRMQRMLETIIKMQIINPSISTFWFVTIIRRM